MIYRGSARCVLRICIFEAVFCQHALDVTRLFHSGDMPLEITFYFNVCEELQRPKVGHVPLFGELMFGGCNCTWRPSCEFEVIHDNGRRICKVFGSQGGFEGIVYAADDDAQRNGYRLFQVHYFEDPDDGESMWAEELVR